MVGWPMTRQCWARAPSALHSLWDYKGPLHYPGESQEGRGFHSDSARAGRCTKPAVLGLGTLLTDPILMFEGAAEVRLADGGRRCAGRVEVKHKGQWGTVCGDYWSMNDAAVVCKQLDCGSAVEAPQYGHFGPGSGPVWMSDVGCNGTESALSDCTHGGWGENNCPHSLDAGVTCSGKWTASSPALVLQWRNGPGCALREQKANTRG